jgi:hypothetical protein
MPEVKETDSSMENYFYLVPRGSESKMFFYSYHSTQDGYDVYTTGEQKQEELNHVLELIRPFTERNWDIGVEYTAGFMVVYLPEFLPDIKKITTEVELLHVCRRVDSFYSFLKRTLLWRYGNIDEWTEGEVYQTEFSDHLNQKGYQ